MYFGYQPLIRYMICRYFLPFDRLSIHFVDGFFCVQKLYFVVVPTCIVLLLLPLLLASNLKNRCQD